MKLYMLYHTEMSNTEYKICSSGLTKDELNVLQSLISKDKNLVYLEESIFLPPKCTHLVTKTTPELKKTEKVLSALARGIPIIEFKYIKKITNTHNKLLWNAEEFDVGGK